MEKEEILIRKNKIITREKLFKNKANFHKKQAKLSFKQKIKILIELQKIAKQIKKNRIVWKISNIFNHLL